MRRYPPMDFSGEDTGDFTAQLGNPEGPYSENDVGDMGAFLDADGMDFAGTQNPEFDLSAQGNPMASGMDFSQEQVAPYSAADIGLAGPNDMQFGSDAGAAGRDYTTDLGMLTPEMKRQMMREYIRQYIKENMTPDL